MTLLPAGTADAGAFLARLVRLDPGALVRLRRSGGDRVALWARLPFDALVTRTVAGSVSVPDVTVAAGALLAGLARRSEILPPRLDAQWRWPLPAEGGGQVVEVLPAARLRDLGAAAERTARAAGAVRGGTRSAERAVRDALLDHVAIVVRPTVNNHTSDRIEIPQRLVQALIRMSFLRVDRDAEESPVRVVTAGVFVGLAAEYGVSWYSESRRMDVLTINRTDELN